MLAVLLCFLSLAAFYAIRGYIVRRNLDKRRRWFAKTAIDKAAEEQRKALAPVTITVDKEADWLLGPEQAAEPSVPATAGQGPLSKLGLQKGRYLTKGAAAAAPSDAGPFNSAAARAMASNQGKLAKALGVKALPADLGVPPGIQAGIRYPGAAARMHLTCPARSSPLPPQAPHPALLEALEFKETQERRAREAAAQRAARASMLGGRSSAGLLFGSVRNMRVSSSLEGALASMDANRRTSGTAPLEVGLLAGLQPVAGEGGYGIGGSGSRPPMMPGSQVPLFNPPSVSQPWMPSTSSSSASHVRPSEQDFAFDQMMTAAVSNPAPSAPPAPGAAAAFGRISAMVGGGAAPQAAAPKPRPPPAYKVGQATGRFLS